MGDPTFHSPALLITAAFSRYEESLRWAKSKTEAEWGPIALESPAFDFSQTAYYEPSMGAGLKKIFWAFERPYDPAATADTKLATNRWEVEYAAQSGHTEERPLNLDPGYITLGKLVLSSTKDFAHRIYLRDGIYAEVTLLYRHKAWQHHEWTFPDYRRADYQEFFDRCRDYLHDRLRGR